MVEGPKGTIFMGTRQLGRVYAITNKDGKREVKTLLQGLTQPNGLAIKDGALYVLAINKVFRYDNIEDKLDNPGHGRRADRQVQPAGHDPSQLEVRGLRARRQALHSGRRQLQHLRDQQRHPRPDPPLQRGRLRHGDRGARRAQHGRLRLASGDQGTVVHRQRPRLGRQRRTGGRAERDRQGQGGRLLRLPVLPRQRHRRSGRQDSESLRRRDVAGRVDRTAFRGPGHQVLHRQHVPQELSERRVHRAARLLEPGAEVRLRRGRWRGPRAARPRSSRS